MSNKEKKVQEVESTSEVNISLEDYIAKTKPNPGLVASFKVENASEAIEPRSENAWTEALKAQSEKVYK